MTTIDALPAPAVGTHFRNRLLGTLPPDELALITPVLEPITLRRRQIVYDSNQRIEQVLFVEHGMISVLSVLVDGSGVETGTTGHDGMVGMPVFHGVEVPVEQAMVQVPGDGYQMSVAAFRTLLPELPTLERRLHRYAACLFTLAAQHSACNRKHSVERRCARWLLTVHDQVDGDHIGLTHDFVSQMLGVRRASVTDTLAALERQKLIRVERANVVILDRLGIERLACECYGIVHGFMQRVLSDEVHPNPLADVQTSRDGLSTVGDGTPMASSLDEPTGDEKRAR
jgi:CRP-like cAMP-binding protein